MRTRVRLGLFTVSVGLLALVLPTSVVAAPGSSATVCDGTLVPGTYHTIVVPAGATCNMGDGSGGPVTVLGGVSVGAGGTLLLGQENPGPVTKKLNRSTGTINGGIDAVDAAQVQVHNTVISGGVHIQGGSGPFACGEDNVCFSDLEDDTINGGATINGYNGFWLGFIRNDVAGTVLVVNNDQSFDEIDLGNNVVHGNLICSNNTPLENTGGSPGSPPPDTVSGHDTCNDGSQAPTG